MRKLIALFCMFLIATLPFSVYALEEVEQAEKTTRAIGEEAKGLGFKIDEDAKFEDILVQIDSYQPKTLRAGLLEEQPVNVYASLIGVPVNPTIEIPEIVSINTRVLNVSWEPKNKPSVRVGAVSYIPPAQGFISYRNLGYLTIQIPKIAKEHDVPDEITIDMAARIGFKISETITMTKKDFSMPVWTEQEWTSQRDQYSFFGGYIRAEQIGENNAVLVLYDNNNQRSRPITISEGSASGILTAPGIEPGIRSFNKFRIMLNKIRGAENEIGLLVSNPESAAYKLVKGDSVYTGSEWVVQDILIKGQEGSVTFKNNAGKPPKIVPFKFEGNKVSGSEGAEKLKTQQRDFEALLEKARVQLIQSTEIMPSYANAIATYEKVVIEGNRVIGSGEFGEVYSGGNIASDAQRQIYEIYKKLGFVEKQIDAGRKLLDDFSSVKDRDLIESELKELGDRSNVADRTIILPEFTGEIRVTITNVYPTTEADKPKATIVDHATGLEYVAAKDGVIDLKDIQFRVTGIETNAVNLRLIKDNKEGQAYRVTTNRINIKDTSHSLQLKKLDFKRVAYLSVIPEPKQAYADTTFKLHIPIEKRQIGLPLFSKTLDKEINKTAKLIEKLDKYIEQVEKLHKFWTNLCLITFATVWAKNILRGIVGSTALARDKVNSEWKQKYSDEQARGYKGSYDQYVLNNSAEYNKDYDNVKIILDEIKNGQYKNAEGVQNIKNEESETFKKDYYYAYRRAQTNPQNEVAVKNYISNGLAAEKIEVDESISNVQKKDWNTLTPEEKAKFTGTMDNNAAFADQRKDKSGDARYAALWDNQQTKAEILAVYRRDNIKAAENNYLSEGYKTDLTRVNADSNKYVDYITSLKQTSGGQASEISISEIEKRAEGYYTTSGTLVEGNVKVGETVTINNEKVKVIAAGESTASHKAQLNVYTSGRDSGRLQRVSIDATRYAEVKYSTGGRVESIEVYERQSANGNMGGKDDKRLGEAEAVKATTNDPKLKSSLNQLASCVGGVNTQLSRQKVQSGYNVNVASNIGCSLGRYAVSRPAQTSTGPSCTEYMDPGDCKLLFNACDPVVCPASRCNLDGRWQVDNVVQTGIVGSAFLCAPNWVVFGGDVVMPVCLTGILAGLQNIKSVLQGYNQCLKKSQLEDTSVGICDRLRSYYLCEILWREASALLNTKEGVLGFLTDKVTGVSKGGDEYSKGAGLVDEAGGALSFFTESYAKGVFSGYGGAGFTEAGIEICKAAVFGKAPKIGEFIDSVSRPESPPQFTAFFDATPYSDVTRKDSLYTIFYHIYAGENEDLTYSVFLRGVPSVGQLELRPATITANKLIKAGEFSSENIERVLPTGFSEICIVTTTKSYGTKQECGPGKVTTEFALDWLSEQYVKNQATKRINNEKECVPEEYSIKGQLDSQGVVAAGVGAVSSGLTTTGIIRTCAQESPGLGTDKANWARVGNCGNDELGRDLGGCWLFKPSVDRALQQEYTEKIAEEGIFAVGKEIEIEGLDKALEAQALDKDAAVAKIIFARNLLKDREFVKAIEELKLVMDRATDVNTMLIARYELANFYYNWAIRVKATQKTIEESKMGQAPLTSEWDIQRKKLNEAYLDPKNDRMLNLLNKFADILNRRLLYDNDPMFGALAPDVDLSEVNNFDEYMQTIFKALEPKYGAYTYELRNEDTQKLLVIKKKTGKELSEAETIAQLVKEYNLAYEKHYNVLTLMRGVGEITSKEIVYQNTEVIQGYEVGVGPLSGKLDMSKVTTVKEFVESFLSPMGAYEVEVTDTKIIIKQ